MSITTYSSKKVLKSCLIGNDSSKIVFQNHSYRREFSVNFHETWEWIGDMKNLPPENPVPI